MTVYIYDLWLCMDCMPVAVNGDYSGLDYYYQEPELTERREQIRVGLACLPNLVPDYDSETGDGVKFSSAGCDCCESELANTMYRFATLKD